MFSPTYVVREVVRRPRQAVLGALGLALGIGMVVAVTAMSTGIHDAQDGVLSQLSGVGTDMQVSLNQGQGDGPRGVGIQFGEDEELEPGEKFSRDDFVSPGSSLFKTSKTASIDSLADVEDVAAGLSLEAIHLEGTVPEGRPAAPGGVGGSTGDVTEAPAPIGDVEASSYSVQGVDVTKMTLGPLSSEMLANGRLFAASDATAKVAVVDRAYAKEHDLKVGSTITVKDTEFEVVGLARTPLSGQGADVYLPLGQLQKVADMKGRANRFYVRATDASNVDQVAAEIEDALPSAEVTTASDLADRVSGSLVDASSLAGRLGLGLAIVSLVMAVVISVLLMLSSLTRRVREFGTLKALGWSRVRVVRLVIGSALLQGLLGAALGIGIGIAGAAVIESLFPALQASVDTAQAFLPPRGPIGSGEAESATQAVTVAVTAPVDTVLMLAAAGLAVAAGLLTGVVGGWRVARIRPAEALRSIE
jgi:ABC-type antimicrobial peptide transport system permease subunit